MARARPRRSLPDAYRWLRSLGLRDWDIARALRLAKKSALARIGPHEAVVIVPSQRLGSLPREKTVAHEDLAAILRGTHALTQARVGKLPPEQQLYPVHVTPQAADCPCPATRLGGDPLCVHKLAAAVKLYLLGRDDLLAWLPKAAEEKRKGRKKMPRPRPREPPLSAWQPRQP